MRGLYPISCCILVVVLLEEYSVPFPSYLDKKSYLRMAKDGMHMRNHDFNETAELVCYDLFSLIFFLFEREFLCCHFVLVPPLL